ncbi:hypothetical protein DL769_008464 [Monosporascus sp. CRB-8-3]|nr:hypothetical protein DL769_008464 [Monosporascus sp. CRB-8-3]
MPGTANLNVFRVRFAIACLALFQTIQVTALPPPTGQYHVGPSKHVIEHFNPNHPVAPDGVTTSLLATIYYPTLREPTPCKAPYLSPEIASLYEDRWNFTAGTLSSLTSTLQEDAPFLGRAAGRSSYPTLIFGPGGGGPPVESYTILLSELASHGYTVVGLDHPHEQPFVRYPNGTVVYGLPLDFNYTMEIIEAIYKTRLEDTSAFLDSFPALVEELNAPFNTTHFAAFGHSLGGAAAVESLYGDDRLLSAINMDGMFFGRPALNTSEADVGKPSFLFGMEIHTGEDENHDITWGTFPRWQTDYWRKLPVTGAVHIDFSDVAFWATVGESDAPVGSVPGARQVEIVNTFVKAFLDYSPFGRETPILDGPSKDWPEFVFDAEGPV